MEPTSFHKGDEYGLGVGSIPHVAIKLTPEQVELITHKKMDFYSIEGKTLFEVRGEDKKPTGEMMFFVVFT